ncbi:uncharacterized protein LOC144548347 [Carex rostrata]
MDAIAAIPFIKQILSKSALRAFLGSGADVTDILSSLKPGLWAHSTDKKVKTIKSLHVCFRKFGISRRMIAGRTSGKESQLISHRELIGTKRTLNSFIDELVSISYLEQIEVEVELEHKVDIDAVMNSLHDIKSMEDLLLDNANSSNCFTNDEKSRALLLITAFPALRELNDPNEMLRFLLELSTELDNLPELICQACEGQPQALLLIGSLLSVKPTAYDTWHRVKDDLVKIKESNNACYPMNYEIPARSLTEIWIAEEFVEQQEGETIEETANKYLDQLVQRSLVRISKRSISGAIKCCRVRQSIREFCIKKSYEEKILDANPTGLDLRRLAFYNDGKKQFTGSVFEETSGCVGIKEIHNPKNIFTWHYSPRISRTSKISGLEG